MEGNRRKFTGVEDNTLRRLVREFGAHHWESIAAMMPGRTGRQCRDRYQTYLSPGITNGEWTLDEERVLREKYAEIGPKWSQISEYLPGRTGTSLKNRWNYYIAKNEESEAYRRMVAAVPISNPISEVSPQRQPNTEDICRYARLPPIDFGDTYMRRLIGTRQPNGDMLMYHSADPFFDRTYSVMPTGSFNDRTNNNKF